jgi:nitrilase
VIAEAVRVAAVQAAPVFLERDATVEKAVWLIEEAASNGARLVVFPETWIPGYPAWIFGAAGWDDPRAKQVYARLQRNAVEAPGAVTDILGRAAGSAGVHVVVGVTERDVETSRGTLFNSLVYVSDSGELLGVHRKIMPTHAERIVWGLGDGSTLHVFDTPIGRLGGLICWEHWMPLARFAMHAKGEQLHVAAWPEVGNPELHRLASRHYAFEGRCFSLCVMGAALTPDRVPGDFEIPEALVAADDFAGAAGDTGPGTAVFAPDGAVVAEAPAGEEMIVYADLDLASIGGEQQALDTVGHYNRPDIFDVRVDETPRRQVRWIRPEPTTVGEP